MFRLALTFAVAAFAQSDEAAIRALEAKWDHANLKGDASALESVFADSLIATDGDGKVRTKAEMVGALRSGDLKYESARTEDVKIILHGDAAVVSGRWIGTYSYKGRKTSLRERFTNFYVKQKGQWRCVATHGSTLR